ncbi:phospholipase C4 PlcD [Mycobacterium tuberculosis MAL020192]|nr:phospholipase C4 PlcD [Mycobacterium tuberculosis MAL020192]KCQ91845.1 phospholipase C4 PlcD [Mycobacterium tuberculosis BTB11-343]
MDYPGLHALSTVPQCVPNAALGTINRGIPYRVPDPQIMPTQETTPTRGIPSGPC